MSRSPTRTLRHTFPTTSSSISRAWCSASRFACITNHQHAHRPQLRDVDSLRHIQACLWPALSPDQNELVHRIVALLLE